MRRRGSGAGEGAADGSERARRPLGRRSAASLGAGPGTHSSCGGGSGSGVACHCLNAAQQLGVSFHLGNDENLARQRAPLPQRRRLASERVPSEEGRRGARDGGEVVHHVQQVGAVVRLHQTLHDESEKGAVVGRARLHQAAQGVDADACRLAQLRAGVELVADGDDHVPEQEPKSPAPPHLRTRLLHELCPLPHDAHGVGQRRLGRGQREPLLGPRNLHHAPQDELLGQVQRGGVALKAPHRRLCLRRHLLHHAQQRLRGVQSAQRVGV
mmetsp:Transcript_10726/g.41671  ORF Transcript_10726/g.41671 Transcript_10726/m.41671 type:complete len:270 (-) Transcript_10726:54-863(-)